VRYLSVFVALLIGSACSTPPVGEAAVLPGSSWTVERIVLEDGGLERGDGTQTITFGDDGSIAVSSCNDCAGRYTIEGDALALEDVLACTKRACPTGTLELERLLSGTTQISRDGDFLVLQPDSSDTRVLLARSDVDA
jgi:heat shock protein HslJ